jgi:hypothetical protein
MLFTVAQYFAAIATILTTLGLFIKWAVVAPIKAYIDHATYPISPGANGGLSLADANKTLKRIETKLEEVDDRLVQVENLVTKPATRAKKSTQK